VTLSATPKWKEMLIITDEAGRSMTFDCGWGVTPGVAYVPSEADWTRSTPEWLWLRRDEVIATMRSTGHAVEVGYYPAR
jgi:hypothetical protein